MGFSDKYNFSGITAANIQIGGSGTQNNVGFPKGTFARVESQDLGELVARVVTLLAAVAYPSPEARERGHAVAQALQQAAENSAQNLESVRSLVQESCAVFPGTLEVSGVITAGPPPSTTPVPPPPPRRS